MKLKLTKNQQQVFSRIQDLGLALRAGDQCEEPTECLLGKPLMPLLKGFFAGTEAVSVVPLNSCLNLGLTTVLLESDLVKKEIVAADLSKDKREELIDFLEEVLQGVVDDTDAFDPKVRGVSLKNQ